MSTHLGQVDDALGHIGPSVAAVLKEIIRRAELRDRLEAEWGRSLSDQEFLKVAERTGVKI